MAASIQIHATTGSGQTLKQLSEIIRKRMEYAHETARGSVAACMLNVLRSLRTIVMVAKPRSVKVNLERDSSLQLSYTMRGKKRIPCLRVQGSHVRYQVAADERFVLPFNSPTRNADRTWQVYRYEDTLSRSKRRKFIIASPTQAIARKYVQGIV